MSKELMEEEALMEKIEAERKENLKSIGAYVSSDSYKSFQKFCHEKYSTSFADAMNEFATRTETKIDKSHIDSICEIKKALEEVIELVDNEVFKKELERRISDIISNIENGIGHDVPKYSKFDILKVRKNEFYRLENKAIWDLIDSLVQTPEE